jgi:AcrR family transcriptional regulator
MVRMKAGARREQLLKKAAQCFAKHGYRGTTTAMIAAEAGVSEPSIYRHFRNKQDLEKLQSLLYRNPATADPWTASVYQLLFHASTEVSEPAIRQAIRDHYDRYLKSLASVMSDAQKIGQIRDDLPAEWLAWQIIHAAVGFAMVRPLEIPNHANLHFVQGTIQLLMELLTRPTRRGNRPILTSRPKPTKRSGRPTAAR